MIVYFSDRYMNILGMASTDLPGNFVISNDKRIIDLDSGVSSFEMDLGYTAADQIRAKELAAVGNYVLRYHNDQYEYYTIIETENDSLKNSVYLYAEDAGLDLLNQIVGEYAASSAQPISTYINLFTSGSGFEIGNNEISDRTRKLSWDGEATAAERVRSVATQFDAEIGYRFEIDGLVVTHKYIDIYASRGFNTGVELRLGREVKQIVEKQSIANLVTALYPTGATPSGSSTPINLVGYTYDDGDIYNDNGTLKSRSALAKWGRNSGTNDIVGTYSYETETKSVLCSHAVSQLQKQSKPETNYDIALYYLPSQLKIGDTARIIDHAGGLYLSARLLVIEESVTEHIYNATMGDYLIEY